MSTLHKEINSENNIVLDHGRGYLEIDVRNSDKSDWSYRPEVFLTCQTKDNQ